MLFGLTMTAIEGGGARDGGHRVDGALSLVR